MSEASKTLSPLFQNYARTPLSFERGEGPWLFDQDGNRYLDFMAGIAVNSLGHAHPHLVEALSTQAGKLWHVSNVFEIPEGERFAARLRDASFADQVIFTNSGAEALEAAIKTARRYHFLNDAPERYRILTLEGAFHGRTLATIAAGGQEKYLEGFGPKVEGFDNFAREDEEAFKAAIAKEDTAAVLVEPIQGEGGIRVFDTQWLRNLRQWCDDAGVLLILDEVQTGVGRTGHLFAHEAAGIEPDLMALAKGIGGGFPVGACLATAEVAQALTPGSHGTTYGGNPLAMAVGNAVMDVILEDGFLDHVRAMGGRLTQRLAAIIDAHPDLYETIRGEGLMLGIKCKIPAADLVAASREAGLLLVGAGDNVVRLLPPLIITEDHIDEAAKCLEEASAALQKTLNGAD